MGRRRGESRNLAKEMSSKGPSMALALLLLVGVVSEAGARTSLRARDQLQLQLQQRALLQSANVELSRRSLQREQRETQAADQQQQLVQPQPTCGYPGSPAHASVTFNTTHVVAGTAASYTCDNGYELLGPPRRVCQANGSWSPVGIPFCGK